ncbi:MAG: hypothetical protein DRO12_01195 [Thermoprotei archaeon]|nr:MAG: hypothetical protein DRO12_01195 [Thermoprotei archaeon]
MSYSFFIFLSASIFTAFTTALLTFFLIEYEKKFGRLCRDYHKPYDVYVPCIGGPSYFASIALGFLALSIWLGIELEIVMAIELSLVLGFLAGLLDDYADLDVKWKVIAGALPALPIIFAKVYKPYLTLPLLGTYRMSIVYPLLILIGSTVAANSANMVDTHNGLLTGSATLILAGALLLEITKGCDLHALALTATSLAAVVTFHLFNRYPAMIFNGNSGSFFIGSLIAVIAITTKLEYFFVTTWMPFTMSGFYFIASMKKLVKRNYIPERPVVVKKGFMYPNIKKDAPITLVHVAVLPNPLNESELVKAVMIAVGFFVVLGIITTILWM